MLVRPVMKSLFFLGKPRKKRLASLARLIIISDVLRKLVQVRTWKALLEGWV